MLNSFKGELKQQGVEELARDPKSNVTADDAQKVIVEESKKAGAVALTFDPNATPEEKAAQARSVRSEQGTNITITDKLQRAQDHKRPPKGMGIVTDIVSTSVPNPQDRHLPYRTTERLISMTCLLPPQLEPLHLREIPQKLPMASLLKTPRIGPRLAGLPDLATERQKRTRCKRPVCLTIKHFSRAS